MLILKILSAILLFTVVETFITYLIRWYDLTNFGERAVKGAWPRDINMLQGLKGICLDALSFFFHIVSTPTRFYYDKALKKVPCEKQPILMVHGWSSGSHAFLLMRGFLKRRGYRNIYALTYRPVLADVKKLAQQVADRIDRVLDVTGADSIDVITHSMGGVLARYTIKHLEANKKIRKVISLGGPHMGTRIVTFVPFGRSTMQMTYQGDFISRLSQGGLTPGDVKYTAIYSDFDNYVLPYHSSDLGAGAKNIQVPFHGHFYLLYSPRIMKLVADELEDFEKEEERAVSRLESISSLPG